MTDPTGTTPPRSLDSLFTIPPATPFEELLSLRGRTALVTGGGRGLGKCIVQRFAQAGANVVLTARHADQLEAVVTQYASLPGELFAVAGDVSNTQDRERMLHATLERFGGVDILVNNAAIYPPGDTLSTSEQMLRSVLAINVEGPYFLSQAIARQMIDQGRGGRIINFLSTAFEDAAPMFSAYALSKAAVWEMTRVMAHEFATHRITVNAVTPGSTLTEEKAQMLATGRIVDALGIQVPDGAGDRVAAMMSSGMVADIMKSRMPMGRMGYPQDLAAAVLYFASDMAAYVTGQNITVRGGQPDSSSVTMPPTAPPHTHHD